MLLLLILPVLVAGFVACHIHPVHSYKLHRYEGQYLYLKSAELGLKCFALGLLLCALAHALLPPRITVGALSFPTLPIYLGELIGSMGAYAHSPSPAANSGAKTSPTPDAMRLSWFLIISLATFVSAYLIKGWALVVLRLRYGQWNTRVFVIARILEDSPLDNLLFNASLQKGKHIMLTMEDRKVYVGKVISLGEPSETAGMDQDISIMPILSGYRDKDALTVTFTTHYEDAGTDIYVALRQDKIVSATEFSLGIYKRWAEARRNRLALAAEENPVD